MAPFMRQVLVPDGTVHVPPPLTEVMYDPFCEAVCTRSKCPAPVEGIVTVQLLQVAEVAVKFAIEYVCVGGVKVPRLLLNASALQAAFDDEL